MLRIDVRRRRGDFLLEAAFAVPSTAVVALFGPSGCGKTTLVNIVAGLLAPDAGRVEIDGEVLCDVAAGVAVAAERRRIGYVFQDPRLFPHLGVRANLEYGLRRRRGVEARISFDDVVQLLGLESLLGRRPATLSGGERQRVALGRALLSQPRLLLLDEPLASLDAARRSEVLPYLEQLRDRFRIPMLYVSHQFEEVVRLATDVVLLEAGRVVATGPLTQVSGQPALARLAGTEAVGAVIDSVVTGIEPGSGLVRVPAGAGEMRLPADGLVAGRRVRLQVLARDVIVATRRPEGLSVRNALPGTVLAVTRESAQADLVVIDVGGVSVTARVTAAATRELGLAPGVAAWALVKAVSVRAADGGPPPASPR